jgi:hypothetical protein
MPPKKRGKRQSEDDPRPLEDDDSKRRRTRRGGAPSNGALAEDELNGVQTSRGVQRELDDRLFWEQFDTRLLSTWVEDYEELADSIDPEDAMNRETLIRILISTEGMERPKSRDPLDDLQRCYKRLRPKKASPPGRIIPERHSSSSASAVSIPPTALPQRDSAPPPAASSQAASALIPLLPLFQPQPAASPASFASPLSITTESTRRRQLFADEDDPPPLTAVDCKTCLTDTNCICISSLGSVPH